MDNTTRHERSNSSASANSDASFGQQRKGSLFNSLEQQKRSTDPAQVARRASMHDHKPAPGIFGRMWNDYVHGSMK